MDDDDDDIEDIIQFAPAVVRARHNGWTPEAQRRFIDALAETGCVTAAASAAGMTARSAYRLRHDPRAQAFSDAWEEALDRGIQRLDDVAIKRAIDGVLEPIYYHGEKVGERMAYDNRLLAFVLSRREKRRPNSRVLRMEGGGWRRPSPQEEIDVCAAVSRILHGAPDSVFSSSRDS